MSILGTISSAATGGVYSTDGTGYAQGGGGMAQQWNNEFQSGSSGQKDAKDLWSDTSEMIPGIGDKKAQERANAENRAANIANRDWMERMSNTAYQRAMADMKAAGLNPMLAYQQGGASVPTNTAPVSQAAPATGLADFALRASTGIAGIQTQRMQAATAQAQSESTIALQGAQTASQVAATEKQQAETMKTIDSIQNQKLQRKLMDNQAKLESVKTSAAELANKGVSTLEKVSQTMLKNTAKPNVDKGTLRYNNPLIPDFLESTSDKPKNGYQLKGK